MVGGDGNMYEGAGWDNVYDPGRSEYDDDDKCAIAWIRRGMGNYIHTIKIITLWERDFI